MSETVSVNYPSIEGAECPFHAYRVMRDQAPVYQLPDRPDVYAITRHEDVAYVATHPELFPSEGSRSGLNPFDNLGIARHGTTTLTMGESDPPEHKYRRQLWFQPFKPGRLKALEPVLRQLADEVIDGFIDRGEADFVADFANPLPVKVTCKLLGLPPTDEPKVLEWGQLEPPPGLSWLPPERQERQRAQVQELREFLTEELLDRHANPRDDELSAVIAEYLTDHDELDLDFLVANAALVLAGGVATTAHLMASALLLLLQHPDQMAKVRGDYAHIPRMLEEALRLETPAQWVPRKVRHDTEIAGVTIPAGSFVLLMWAAGNRDERRFEDPDRFDVERGNVNDHLAFGAGPHFCLGSPLARREARIAFEQLFTRLGEIRLAPGNDLRHYPSPAIRGLRSLRIEFDRA